MGGGGQRFFASGKLLSSVCGCSPWASRGWSSSRSPVRSSDSAATDSRNSGPSSKSKRMMGLALGCREKPLPERICRDASFTKAALRVCTAYLAARGNPRGVLEGEGSVSKPPPGSRSSPPLNSAPGVIPESSRGCRVYCKGGEVNVLQDQVARKTAVRSM